MYYVYVLYSHTGWRTYVGFRNDVTRRFQEHNVTGTKGYTLRYRPWTLVRTEEYPSRQEAIQRERYLKTGRGREEVKGYVNEYLDDRGAVSALAEKD